MMAKPQLCHRFTARSLLEMTKLNCIAVKPRFRARARESAHIARATPRPPASVATRTNGDDTEVDTLAKAEALRTKIAVAETVKIDSTASAKALAEFKVACETCLPKLTVNDLQAAIDFFAETVEVEELMPDVKGLQWPTNTGSKLNCSQGRHS